MQVTSVKEFLSNKKIIFFLLGTFCLISNMATSFTVVPIYLMSKGATVAQVGISTAFYSIVAIILRVFLGPIADRKGRKPSMLASAVAFALASLLIWWAPSFYLHLAARCVQAIGLAFFMSTGSSVVSDVATNAVQGSCMGIYRGFLNLGFMLGPVISIGISKIGYGEMFIANILMAGIAGILFSLVPETGKNTEKTKHESLLKNYQELLKNKKLILFYLLIVSFSMGYGAIMSNAGIYLQTIPNIWSSALFLFLISGTGFLACLIAGRLVDLFGIKRVLLPAICFAVAGLVAMFTVQYFGNIAYILAAICFGIGNNGAVTCVVTGIGGATRGELKATSFSVQESSIDGGNAIGSIVFGLVATYIGLGKGFLAIAMLIALSSGILVVLAFNKKKVGKMDDQN